MLFLFILWFHGYTNKLWFIAMSHVTCNFFLYFILYFSSMQNINDSLAATLTLISTLTDLLMFDDKVSYFLQAPTVSIYQIVKDTQREINKTPTLSKIMNMNIWIVGRSNQLFMRGS